MKQADAPNIIKNSLKNRVLDLPNRGHVKSGPGTRPDVGDVMPVDNLMEAE